MFTGCTNNATQQSSDGVVLPKSNYPAAPAKIMQTPLTRADASVFKLEDYKGKVILLNLWATWCGPCVKEMPDFEKLYQANKDKGFEIIGVNADDEETAEIVKSFGEKLGINYQLVKSDRDFAIEFIKISKVDAIPQTFLIDREGKLVGVFVGGGGNVEKIKTSVAKVLGS